MFLIQNKNKENFIFTFLLVVVYAFAFYGINIFLSKTGIVQNWPTSNNIVNWDANFYKSIAENGYKFDLKQGSNSGFAMLFPIVWEVTHLGGWGISILNVVFFAIGFSILTFIFNISMTDKLLWLSLPSVFYAFVPYSEALFFLLISLLFYGIFVNKRWIIWITLFLMCINRVTTIFLVPGFLAMSLFTNYRKFWYKSLFTYLINYLIPIVAGLGYFVLYQYWKTGYWFAYFYQQTNNWGHKFTIPTFPLGDMQCANGTFWLNGLAMFVGFLSFLFICFIGIKWLFLNIVNNNRFLVISFCYLFSIIYIILFYNPTWCAGTTVINGTYRYELLSPFFYVFLYNFTKNIMYKWWHYLFVFVLSTCFWLAFGSYKHITYTFFFLTNTIFIIFYMLHSNSKYTLPAIVLTSFNIFIQIHLFQYYISGIFPD